MAQQSPPKTISQDWLSRIARLQPWYLLIRFPHRWTRSLFALAGVAIAMGIISVAAIWTGQPLLFPSLGPCAFLFFTQPASPTSAPRNAILAHASAILIGAASCWVFGELLTLDASTAQVAAATSALGLLSAWMVAARIPHAPAASTAMIVALGLIGRWQEMAAIMELDS